jgi:dsRNA-specific ribonuclease
LWEDYLKDSKIIFIDSKTRLQEYSLKKYKSLPIYKLISNTGPRHKPNFKVAVRLENSKYIYANGASIKNAEQDAAKKFLESIKI